MTIYIITNDMSFTLHQEFSVLFAAAVPQNVKTTQEIASPTLRG